MRVALSHGSVRKGFILRKTFYEVSLSVSFTHEEMQIIRMRGLAKILLMERRPANARVDDRDQKFERWARAQGVRDSELVALNLAIRRAGQEGAPEQARALEALRVRVLAAMPSTFARRAEADAEALPEAQGFASRWGPRVAVDLSLLGAVTEDLRQPCELQMRYRGAAGTTQERLIDPHRLLLGTRRYLIARPSGGDGIMRRFRLDRVEAAEITGRVFARDPNFDLEDFSARAFGVVRRRGRIWPRRLALRSGGRRCRPAVRLPSGPDLHRRAGRLTHRPIKGRRAPGNGLAPVPVGRRRGGAGAPGARRPGGRASADGFSALP
ncbi:WYL domain-containing protein [Pseudoroseicyclus sp. CLL3-39]|uniref:WYL domain-containing protein n=1 Tax=Pseudoroseicyclus tamaricis TaxID=2705421 RepID=A0A6B2JPG1_9RHOB|nr:WYL domain-containing protein [Pseudoroseicyclus tamaricis]NDV00577.1 WYL domain-containing protein [Pseudoroseicyclus tamaricis]